MLTDRMPATLPPGTIARLETYAALLATWTRRINLVSRADHAHLWRRHIEDSLRLLPHVPPGISHAIDLGSGAGLPGKKRYFSASMQMRKTSRTGRILLRIPA